MQEIVFRGRLDTFTGYGQQFCPLLEQFIKWGFDVKVRATDLDESFTSVVPQLIKDCRVKDEPQSNEWEWQMLPLGPHHVSQGKKVIYSTMWEADQISPVDASRLNQCACVVVPCDYNAEAFVNSGVQVPIRVVPLGIDRNIFRYRMPRDRSLCVFGAAGRMGHGRIRKGLVEIIAAFKKAFPKEQDVRLEVKCFTDDKMESDPDARVKIVTRYFTDQGCADWLANLSAFVGFWRSEGWGLWQHKAASVGRSVVGPIYSGPTMFLNAQNSFGVDYELENAGEFQTGSGRWCRPDPKSLVEQMRHVYANRFEAESKGVMASVDTASFTLERTALGVLETMNEFGMLARSPVKRTRDLVFKHSGDWGDIIWALPVIRHFGGGILWISEADFTRQRLTPERAEKLGGLLAMQPYIREVRYGNPKHCDYDLDTFRRDWKPQPETKFGVYECQAACWGLTGEICSEAWITADFPHVIPGKPVVINRTARYHNDAFPWKKVADKYRKQAVFVGTQEEHREFTRQVRWPELIHHKTLNFLELARVIQGCSLFVSNQGAAHTVAEAMKKNIVLEVCAWDPATLFYRDNCLNVWGEEVNLPNI